jgi:nitronate monooxygenase
MGIGVSNWRLARAVSMCGHMGVVSGTSIDCVMTRRLQLGDPEGHMRRALSNFPIAEMAQRILDRYFIPGGKKPEAPFKPVSMQTIDASAALTELTVISNFVEVFLAKEGHSGPVGVNFMEKIQLPTIPSLFGVMMAGIDYILMGAGIPRAIPGILDKLAVGEATDMKVDVEDVAAPVNYSTHFDPKAFCGKYWKPLNRPQFLAIISSSTLALTLAKKASGKVDGFIIEGACAGGHNAPPRGQLQLNERGEPVYGPRDQVDLDKIREIGLPFWLAGAYAEPERLKEAQAIGATGIQVGTAFAFCEESAITPELKKAVLEKSKNASAEVFTDPVASPTGFPFKVAQLEGSLSDEKVYAQRERLCDVGLLRHYYQKEDGTLGYRCPAEPIDDYVRKGGKVADTAGRKCICNGLLATVGLGQVRDDGTSCEAPIITAGDDISNVARFLKPGHETYTAKDVIDYIMSPVPATANA